MHIFLTTLIILLSLVGLFSLGFVIPPRPFRPHPEPSHPGEPLPFRPDLPEPVRKHFIDTLGETPPQVTSAVVWGRGRATIRGVWVPLRYKAWYRPGEAYARRMEVTWFQRPVLRGRDYWNGSQGLFEMGDRVEHGEKIDQGQVLTMWAEAVWMPSILVHASPVRWVSIDDQMARMEFPFGDDVEALLAHFDPLSKRMTHLSGMRYAEDSPEKERWRVDLLEWKTYNGLLLPSNISVAWGESGSPWSYWSVDGVAYNVNVANQLGEK